MKSLTLLLAAAAVLAAAAQQDLATLSATDAVAAAPGPDDAAAPSPATGADDVAGLWGGLGDDEDDAPPSDVQTADGGGDAAPPPRKLDARTKKVLADPRVDPSSLSDKKGSFALYGRYCGPGWTDRADREGIDAVDEACHAHDKCYGDAYANTAPKSKERVKAECACDRVLVKTLQTWKKDKAAVAAVSADGRKVADDIIAAMPAKCATFAVAGIFLPHKKAPPPADDDGSSVLGR